MFRTITFFALLALPLAGCLQDPASRGLVGVAGGAIVTEAFGGNPITGAVIGGLAGIASCGIDIGLPACY